MYPICKTLLLELHHVSLLNLFQVELKQKENRAHKARHLVHQAHMQGTTNKLYPKDSSDVYGKKPRWSLSLSTGKHLQYYIAV